MNSRGAAMGSTSAISSSTACSLPQPPDRASDSRPSLVRCATSCRSGGLPRKTLYMRDPKRIYYLSMEFLIGRSLANNVTNLLLDPAHQARRRSKGISTGSDLLEQEPDAGLGNGGLGRLAACFLDSMATMQLPAMGYGLRYEYGIFKQTIRDGWQQEQPTTGCAARSLGGCPPAREGRNQAELLLRDSQAAACSVIPDQPSTLIGIPFDRPVVGYGGKTINTLRLWAAAAPDYFDFQDSAAAISSAHWRRLWPPNRSRACFIPTIPRHAGRVALRAGVFPGRLLAGRSGTPLPAPATDWSTASREGRHPAQ